MSEQKQFMVPAITVNELERRLAVLKQYIEDQRTLAMLASDGVPTFGDNLVTAYVKSLAELMGDTGGWLDWFIWENDFGKRGLECSWTENGKRILIKVKKVSHLMKAVRGVSSLSTKENS